MMTLTRLDPGSIWMRVLQETLAKKRAAVPQDTVAIEKIETELARVKRQDDGTV